MPLDLRNGVLNVLYDYCESTSRQVRVFAYRALVEAGFADPHLVHRNADVLVQLLAVPQPEEQHIIRDGLRTFLALQPKVTLNMLLAPEVLRSPAARQVALSFLVQAVQSAPLQDGARGMPSTGGDAFPARLVQEPEIQTHLAVKLAENLVPRTQDTGLDMLAASFLQSVPDQKSELQALAQLLTGPKETGQGQRSAGLWALWENVSPSAHLATQALLDALVLRGAEKLVVSLYRLRSIPPESRVGPDSGEIEAAYEVWRDALPRLAKSGDHIQGGNAPGAEDVPGGVGIQMLEAIKRVLNYIVEDEPLLCATPTTTDRKVANVQVIYERFRVGCIGDQVGCVLPLVSAGMKVPLARLAALAALTRRQAAIRHGTVGAYDTKLVRPIVEGLISVPVPTGQWDASHTLALEAAEAVFWGLSMALPLVCLPSVTARRLIR